MYQFVYFRLKTDSVLCLNWNPTLIWCWHLYRNQALVFVHEPCDGAQHLHNQNFRSVHPVTFSSSSLSPLRCHMGHTWHNWLVLCVYWHDEPYMIAKQNGKCWYQKSCVSSDHFTYIISCRLHPADLDGMTHSELQNIFIWLHPNGGQQWVALCNHFGGLKQTEDRKESVYKFAPICMHVWTCMLTKLRKWGHNWKCSYFF